MEKKKKPKKTLLKFKVFCKLAKLWFTAENKLSSRERQNLLMSVHNPLIMMRMSTANPAFSHQVGFSLPSMQRPSPEAALMPL